MKIDLPAQQWFGVVFMHSEPTLDELRGKPEPQPPDTVLYRGEIGTLDGESWRLLP